MSNTTTAARYTDELREAAGEQWERVINHEFTKLVASGKIEKRHMTPYLIQDHRFLDAFVVLLASIVANARSLDDRIKGCQFLALITGKENTYFERSFDKLGVTPEQRDSIPDAPCTTAFCGLMREVATTGSLAEMLAVIVVCEWSYLSWGEKVLPTTVREDFVCYEWVDLHSGEYFEGVVEYLRNLLDAERQHLNDQQRDACQKRFLQAIQCEEDFFEFAMSS